MEDHVTFWLQSCGLEEYAAVFKTNGYDDINLIKLLNEGDLDAMGIDKPGTRKKLLLYADQLKQAYQEPVLHLDPIPIQHTPQPRPKGNNRANPYRCTKCCEYKIRSLDGKAHQCKPELIGHSWEDCPTKNLRQHPEEKQRRKMDDKQTKVRGSRKRKQQDDPHAGWDAYPHGEDLSDDYTQSGVPYQNFADDPHLMHFPFDTHDTDPQAKRQKIDSLHIAMLPELEDQLASGSSDLPSPLSLEDDERSIPY